MGSRPFRRRSCLGWFAARRVVSRHPSKFLAPSLSLSVVLDVGRHAFAVFNKLEWLLAATVLLMAFGARARLSAMKDSLRCPGWPTTLGICNAIDTFLGLRAPSPHVRGRAW